MADRTDEEGIEETEAAKSMKAGLAEMIDGGEESDAVKAMRTGLAQMISDGTTPRQRGAEKAAEALDWLFRWGWSSRTMIATLHGTGRGSALGTRLVRNGWARSEPIRIASSYRLTPTDILKITPLGVAELEAMRGGLPSSDGGPIRGRVHKQNVIHDLWCQRLTLMYMGRWPGFEDESDITPYLGWVTDFVTARQLGGDTKKVKRPDAIWTLNTGLKLALEVEMSPKYDRELHQFICGHIRLQQDGPKKVDGLVIFCGSQKTADRYWKAMATGSVIRDWQWDHKMGEWYAPPGATLVVPAGFELHIFVLPSE